MHPSELKNTLKSMVVLVDTREQDTDSAKRRYALFECPWIRKKLDFGDYSAEFTLPDGTAFSIQQFIAIERKMSLDELCGCFTHDRERFQREFERAKEKNAKLYLLVENASFELAYAGKYRSKMNPAALVASMLAWLTRYDCQIIMCKAETSGKLIRDILMREGKQILEELYVSD